MKRILTAIMIVAFVLTLSGITMAQSTTQTISVSIPTIKVVRVAPAGAINLAITPPVNPGDAPAAQSDATKYLQYTVVSATATQVQASITAGTLPTGTQLQVAASTPSGGTGTCGTAAGTITLTGVAANILTTVGPFCYTGTGATNGSNLTFTFSPTGVNIIPTAAANITVTLTIL